MDAPLTPWIYDSGELEAQTLAKRGGGLYIDIVSSEGGLDDLPLVGLSSEHSVSQVRAERGTS